MAKTGPLVKMGTVWDRTIEFISDNLGAVTIIALLLLFVPNSLSGALAPLMETATPGTQGGLFVATIVVAIVTLLGQLALVALVFDPARGVGAIGDGARRLLPTIGVSLVLLIPIGLVFGIAAMVIFSANGVDLTAMPDMESLPPAAVLQMALFFIVSMVVLLWLFARLSVLLPVIVAERLGLGAIGRSWRLTSGHTWRIIGMFVLFIVVVIVASMAVAGVFGTVLALILGAGDGPLSMAVVITAILGALVQTVFTVIYTVFLARLYQALALAADPAEPFA